MPPTRGLILGKFYPPHRGHGYLIATATKQVDNLTVLICQSSNQDIPASLRQSWLQQLYPTVTFQILDQDRFDKNKAQAWVDATLEILGSSPDVIFSSEEYGSQYAQMTGCAHTMVDLHRTTIPCSASQIRENPLQYLEYLEEPVARYFKEKLAPVKNS